MAHDQQHAEDQAANPAVGRYWLTRIVFLRCLGFIYLVAFMVALNDNEALLGEDGLLPSRTYLSRVGNQLASSTPWERFLKVPTLFWFVPATDRNLNFVAGVGVGLSGFLMARGAANLPVMVLLWVLYHTIVNVGQAFYSFGWESQLLETGFLAIFLVPWLSLSRFKAEAPPPLVCIWGYRWLLFRVMLGAGLIKIRGDQCWRDLTCMQYHYNTQPNPNPLSRFLHLGLPPIWHKVEVLINHAVELVLPWPLLLTRTPRAWAGLAQVAFQAAIALSGNLSFLNWLTALPAIFCFDDAHFSPFFRTLSKARASAAAATAARLTSLPVDRVKAKDSEGSSIDTRSGKHSSNGRHGWRLGGGHYRSWRDFLRRVGKWVRRLINACVFLVLVKGSVPVMQNMLSTGQAMNTSFDSLRIVNSYGAFGTITKVRGEVVLMGTRHPDPMDPKAEWREYEFKCKPGDIDRRPCVITPYHYRLDWLLWFAAFQNYQNNPWLVHLVAKLMDPRDETRSRAASLLTLDPFAVDNEGGGGPPRFIKADLFNYEFSSLQSTCEGDGDGKSDMLQNCPLKSGTVTEDSSGGSGVQHGGKSIGRWWTREWVKPYMPPVSIENDSLKIFLRAYGLVGVEVDQGVG